MLFIDPIILCILYIVHAELLRVDEVEHRDIDTSGDCITQVLPQVLEHLQVAHNNGGAAGESNSVDVSVNDAVVGQLLEEGPFVGRQVRRRAFRGCCPITEHRQSPIELFSRIFLVINLKISGMLFKYYCKN